MALVITILLMSLIISLLMLKNTSKQLSNTKFLLRLEKQKNELIQQFSDDWRKKYSRACLDKFHTAQ